MTPGYDDARMRLPEYDDARMRYNAPAIPNPMPMPTFVKSYGEQL